VDFIVGEFLHIEITPKHSNILQNIGMFKTRHSPGGFRGLCRDLFVAIRLEIGF